MRQLPEGLLRLRLPLEFRTREFRWRSCIICRRIFLRGTLSCSMHHYGLTQVEWVELPKNSP